MIYLIGGSSHVGKTLFSQKLMEDIKVPYVSLDHVKMMFIRSGLTKLTPDDDYEMRYFLWPYMAEYIKTCVENEQSLIVEGCYIPENYRDAFDESYLKDIKSVYMVMSEDYIRNHTDDLINKASVIECRIKDEVDVERLIMCSKEFKELGQANNIPVLEIDKTYDEALILKELKEKLEVSI